MNNLGLSIRPKLRSAWVSVVFVVVLTSCLDDDDDYVAEPIPLAYVSLYHTSPDAPALDVVVDNKRINTEPFGYTDYTNYLNFYTGARAFKFNSLNATNALIDTTFNFADGKFYSLFVINNLSSLEAIVVSDSGSVPAAGKAKVRFINLSPDSPAIDVSLGNDTTALFEGQLFKQSTDFKELDAERYTFEVRNSTTDEALTSATTVDLQPGKFYTILVRGFVNPPAGNNNIVSVQVVNN